MHSLDSNPHRSCLVSLVSTETPVTDPQEHRSTSVILSLSDYDLATECKHQDPDLVLSQ